MPPLASSATVTGLARQIATAERRGHVRALALILPVFLFIVVSFAIPVVLLLSRAVIDPSIVSNLPRTVAALADWDGKELPPETAYAALVADLRAGNEQAIAGYPMRHAKSNNGQDQEQRK